MQWKYTEYLLSRSPLLNVKKLLDIFWGTFIFLRRITSFPIHSYASSCVCVYKYMCAIMDFLVLQGFRRVHALAAELGYILYYICVYVCSYFRWGDSYWVGGNRRQSSAAPAAAVNKTIWQFLKLQIFFFFCLCFYFLLDAALSLSVVVWSLEEIKSCQMLWQQVSLLSRENKFLTVDVSGISSWRMVQRKTCTKYIWFYNEKICV